MRAFQMDEGAISYDPPRGGNLKQFLFSIIRNGNRGMKRRRLFFLAVSVLLVIPIVLGCGTLFRNKELPAGRNVKTVAFPVRHLKFTDVKCRQEYEFVELSGTITNMSSYKLTDVGIKITIFFAKGLPPHEISGFAPVDTPSTSVLNENILKFSILAEPSVLFPRESAEIKMNAEVEETVAKIELHGMWTKSDQQNRK
jgi:hypothetical protein